MSLLRSADFATTLAAFRTDKIHVQLNRFHLEEPLDDLLRTGSGYRLDLSLQSRPGCPRGRYQDRWPPHRFEPIGPLFLIRQGERVHARYDGGQGLAVACQFSPVAIQAWFEDSLEWTDKRLEACFDLKSPALRGLLQKMAAELRALGFAHELLLETVAVQAAIELQRYFAAVEPDQTRGGLSPWRLKRIDERLRENLDPPSMVELATLCGVSVRQLSRAFRTSRGCSLAAHAASARIEHAKRMIAEGQSIKGVAEQLGFGSPSSFTFSFRMTTGVTPRQFRQDAKRGGF